VEITIAAKDAPSMTFPLAHSGIGLLGGTRLIGCSSSLLKLAAVLSDSVATS
jgi:hypothetical protein